MTLADRTLAYLKRHEGEWVSKRTISQLARRAIDHRTKRRFTYNEVTEALAEVEATINVGTKYDAGYWYQWYDMSSEEREAAQAHLDYFESQPDRATLSDSGIAPEHS